MFFERRVDADEVSTQPLIESFYWIRCHHHSDVRSSAPASS
jgi:hypothetical protein